MEKTVTRTAFIGGRLVHPGETVDVDEQGDVICAPSTPIGQMSREQIQAYLRGTDTKVARSAATVGKPLDKQNKTELLQTAQSLGVPVDEEATKADILAALAKNA